MGAGSGDVEKGWYRQRDGRERYWDGRRWTDRYREGNEPPPDPADRSPKDRTAEDEGGKGGWIGTVIGVVLFLVVLACCGWVQASDDVDEEPSGGEALTACHDAVEERIKNPSTADFALLDTTIRDTSISGEVTAQNDLGAEKTLRYRCSMSDSTVTDVIVNEV